MTVDFKPFEKVQGHHYVLLILFILYFFFTKWLFVYLWIGITQRLLNSFILS